MSLRPHTARALWLLAALSLAFALGGLAWGGSQRAAPPKSALFPDAELYRKVEQFRDVLELVHEEYVDEKAASLDKLTAAALKGMLNSLDPHTEFLPAKAFDDMKADSRQEYGGIGVQVENRDGRMHIIAPIKGSPGEKAGLARGDIIVAVSGSSVEGLSLDQMVERLRGKPGTSVTITVLRPSTGARADHTIQRALIETRSVDNSELLPGGIGYISISNFYEKTGEEFREAVRDLQAQGMRALVLDLRNNPGGLLSAAVEVAGRFFRKGELVVYTQGRTPDSRQDLKSRNRETPPEIPVAVLMNSGSASASEIVAGALQDTKRAFVVGETSFGKGLVQSILPLRGGEALRLTTSQYYTPSGRRIQERGVRPDIEVVIPVEEEGRVRLWRSRRDVLSPADFEREYGYAPSEDRQLETAVASLKGVLLLDAR